MIAAQLLGELRACGVAVVVDEHGLVCRGAVPEGLKPAIRAHKDELVELVREESTVPPPTHTEVDAWPDDVRALFERRCGELVNAGSSAPSAAARALAELRAVAFRQLVSRGIADRQGLDLNAFVAVAARAVGRPGPSTREEDLVIAAELLRRGGRR